jgi:DNA-binding winged helix-turn-helix (wHTH) protein
MSQPTASTPLVRFGPYTVDFRSGELHKNGRRIRLQEQPLRVLSVLLEHSGELVARDELRQELWPSDTFVDFDHGLNSAVARLREVLDDSAEAPKYIETLARRGYRFIAPINPPIHVAAESAVERSSLRPLATRVSLVLLAVGFFGCRKLALRVTPRYIEPAPAPSRAPHLSSRPCTGTGILARRKLRGVYETQ